MSKFEIIPMVLPKHWQAVTDIYTEGIVSGNCTYQLEPLTDWIAWDLGHLPHSRLVIVERGQRRQGDRSKSLSDSEGEMSTDGETEEDEAGEVDRVVGWAALMPVSSRPVFNGVAELSIYLTASVQGQGLGSKLMEAIIAESERNGMWTLTSGIFPENKGSLRLHEKAGFRVIGVRENMGFCPHLKRWRDVVLMEKRSTTVGI